MAQTAEEVRRAIERAREANDEEAVSSLEGYLGEIETTGALPDAPEPTTGPALSTGTTPIPETDIDPATGKRIVNEWADRRQRCDAIFKTGHICVGIVDAKGAQMAIDNLKPCLKTGKVKSFERIEDLAAEYSIPFRQFEATVNRYNQMIKDGRLDEFGKPLDQGAQPLVDPPFYAIRLWPKVHYTPGGIGINSKAEIIDLNNQPIPRLFAAGAITAGVHGANRLGSNALVDILVFGDIAGRSAAQRARKKTRFTKYCCPPGDGRS